jgi:hypothetical protein
MGASADLVLVPMRFSMKVTRPLAFKLQDAITVIVGLMEIGEIERAKRALMAMSKLIADQTVRTIETKQSEDLAT